MPPPESGQPTHLGLTQFHSQYLPIMEMSLKTMVLIKNIYIYCYQKRRFQLKRDKEICGFNILMVELREPPMYILHQCVFRPIIKASYKKKSVFLL